MGEPALRAGAPSQKKGWARPPCGRARPHSGGPTKYH